MTRFTPDLFAAAATELTAIRRDIHRHPETAFEEQRTSQIVADKLQSWGRVRLRLGARQQDACLRP